MFFMVACLVVLFACLSVCVAWLFGCFHVVFMLFLVGCLLVCLFLLSFSVVVVVAVVPITAIWAIEVIAETLVQPDYAGMLLGILLVLWFHCLAFSYVLLSLMLSLLLLLLSWLL